MSLSASISTSGSTIGTMPCSWQSAAYRASAWALTSMQYAVGMPSPIVITARHFAKRAPSPRYSSSRSRRPSSPSVTVSPGAPASGFAPVSTLIPGMIPRLGEELRERRAVGRRLADRLVVEDHAADVLLEPGRREEHVAVGAPVLLGRLERDRVEALLDRAGALVGGQDPPVVGDDLPCGRRAARSCNRSFQSLALHQLANLADGW